MYEGLEIEIRYIERDKKPISVRNVVSIQAFHEKHFPEQLTYLVRDMYRKLDKVINYDKDTM